MYTVPIRPRSHGERRSLRTFPGASLRPHLGFNPRPRRLSTPPDAFQLHPDRKITVNGLPLDADGRPVGVTATFPDPKYAAIDGTGNPLPLEERRAFIPVSYTHLTLPTIYSV